MPTAADGQRQLILTDQHNCPAQHLAEDNFFHFGRLKCVGDQDLHIVTEADDVNPLAGQFVDDVLDAVTTNPHASPHTIHPLVGAAYGDFGPVTRFAGDSPYLDDPFGNFGDFLLEEPLNQVRFGAA